MKLELKLIFIVAVLIPVLSGCSLINNNINIETEDLIIEVGQNLNTEQVIDQAIIKIESDDPFSYRHSSKLIGLEAVDWNTPNSYKLVYEVCVNQQVCESKDFEINVVTDINSEQAVEMVRHVYVSSRSLDVPINTRLSENEIISEATIKITDSDDGTFKHSLSISGFESINWNKVGEYQISIGSCDAELNCDKSDTTIHIRDDIDHVQVHKD